MSQNHGRVYSLISKEVSEKLNQLSSKMQLGFFVSSVSFVVTHPRLGSIHDLRTHDHSVASEIKNVKVARIALRFFVIDFVQFMR